MLVSERPENVENNKIRVLIDVSAAPSSAVCSCSVSPHITANIAVTEKSLSGKVRILSAAETNQMENRGKMVVSHTDILVSPLLCYNCIITGRALK